MAGLNIIYWVEPRYIFAVQLGNAGRDSQSGRLGSAVSAGQPWRSPAHMWQRLRQSKEFPQIDTCLRDAASEGRESSNLLQGNCADEPCRILPSSHVDSVLIAASFTGRPTSCRSMVTMCAARAVGRPSRATGIKEKPRRCRCRTQVKMRVAGRAVCIFRRQC
jgi:hypothetical protein